MDDKSLIESTASRLLLEADANAEQLLGIVRMVVAGSIALAIGIALNLPNRPESEFLDKQGVFAAIGMTSYFLVGLAAFILVKTGKYQPWMAWVTATFDVILIITNVWLSINSSGLNTNYALSFPSALMIPLILTFGALRFRPDIQVAMTVFICFLTAGIVFSNPFLVASNSDVLSQMSLTYALPPNLIRIWLVFSTGIVIAIAVWRAKGLLLRITQATEERLNLTRFLPQTVVQDLNDEAMNELKRGRQVPLAIIFLDVPGFTQMAESMRPEDTSVILTEYRSHIIDVTENNGGTVDKFIGDGALVIFGLTGTSEQAAKAALNAAEELNSRFRNWNSERKSTEKEGIEVGIGIHFGEVFLGAIGDARRLEFTILGDNVNIASRIEQMTKSESYITLASQDVINTAGKSSTKGWSDLGERSIRGRKSGIKLWGYAG